MAIDYRERSFVNKNKPRRQPIGIYVAGIFAVVIVVFASGFAGGWFASRYMMKDSALLQQAADPNAQNPPVPGPESQIPAARNSQQPPLTFYETLPKGGKGVIGSGINAGLPEHQTTPAVKPSAPAQAAPAPEKPASAAPSTVVPSEKPVPEKPRTQTTTTDTEKRFTVQIASVKDKAEAESLRNKLAAKGLNPIIFQVNIPDKGVVYRVRAGRHLQLREAQDLAARLGSGAIAVPE